MKALILGGAASMLAGPIVGIGVLLSAGISSGGAAAATTIALCQTSGPITGLTAGQARNARAIAAAAQQTAIADGAGPPDQQRAELIALMTAGTESTLHNYPNPAVPASEQLPNDGPPPGGGDHDSVGLFQQRTSWGSVADRMDPMASTRLFVTRLMAVPAWQTMPPGVAAQTVQQSSYPDRYAALETSATGWLQTIATSPAAGQCGGDGLLATSRTPVPPGKLPNGYSIPPNATDAERRAVTFALAQLGKPYVFGAVGPDSYDCSGLTMAAWAAAGIQLPHYTVAQYQLGTPVADPAFLAPGDLIFIPGDDGSLTPPNPQHVGMYLGDGYVVEAPQTGDVIKVVLLAQFKPMIGARHLAYRRPAV